MMEKKDIFISYRREGAEKEALLLNEKLTTAGYQVFLDEMCMHSGEFTEEIKNTITECTDFILFISPNCFERCADPEDVFLQEIECALKKDKHITQLMVDMKKYPTTLPTALYGLEKKNAIPCPPIRFFDELVRILLEEGNLKSKPLALKNVQEEKTIQNPESIVSKPTNQYSANTVDEMLVIAAKDARENAEMYQTALAAASGKRTSQMKLAKAYYFGNGLITDREKAVYWLSRAAENGDAEAMYLLAKCCEEGSGVEKSGAQALYWFKQSTKQPNPYVDSMWKIGDYYRKGKSVRPDLLHAMYWYQRAMEYENIESANDMEEAMGTFRYVQILTNAKPGEKERLRQAGYTLDAIPVPDLDNLCQYLKKKRNSKYIMQYSSLLNTILIIYTFVIGVLEISVMKMPHCFIAVSTAVLTSMLVAYAQIDWKAGMTKKVKKYIAVFFLIAAGIMIAAFLFNRIGFLLSPIVRSVLRILCGFVALVVSVSVVIGMFSTSAD